jgi:probable phosphoglycerate mutase
MEIKKKITLIRHGATEYNDNHIMQGSLDLPLSKNGILQAERLNEALAEKEFDIIYHSPLLRTYQTAKIVNKNHNLKYIQIDCFREINIGEWEGEKFADVFTDKNEIYKKWIRDANTKIPGGESYVDVQNRVREGIINILKSEYKNILIFGHAAVNRGILGNLLNIEPDLSRRFRLNNCGYATFLIYEDRLDYAENTIENNFVMVENWNVSTHLSDILNIE